MAADGVVVVGAGQAGLATSRELTRAGVEHVVLERSRIAQTWRTRWDSFCLVTPNWSLRLPGYGYDGDDPHGFMPRDEIVAYLERYATAVAAPVREGVEVGALERGRNGSLALQTSEGLLEADTVVLATGAYQRPHRPAAADTLPPNLRRLDVEAYRNPDHLPAGPVLIVGSGQSGCQIAEELHQAGRDVFVACGRAPWSPRRIGDRDVVWWALETGFLDAPVESLPDPRARLAANLVATGHRGGHNLHLRTLRAMGVTLLGHFVGADGCRARFAPDLGESVAWGDERNRMLMDLVRKLVAERGLAEPEIAEAEPFDDRAPEELDLTGFGAVIFATGFRPDYETWVRFPGAFDELGFPIHKDGASTVVDGLYFVGVHFLRKRKSSIFLGVGEDAEIVARGVATRAPRAAWPQPPPPRDR
jgi:putative flavoprotein involved in K+ transport